MNLKLYYLKSNYIISVLAKQLLAIGNQAPKYSTFTKWTASRFKDDRESLEDDPRSGRRQTTTLDIIEAVTSINHFKINEIIHTH